MIQALERHTLEIWQEIDRAARTARPQRIHFMKLGIADYPDPARAHLFLGFPDDARRPVVAAKVARIPEGDAVVVAEYANLSTMQSAFPQEIQRLSPKPLRQGHINRRAFFLQSVRPGRRYMQNTLGVPPKPREFARMRASLHLVEALALAPKSDAVETRAYFGVDQPAEVLDRLPDVDWNPNQTQVLQEILEAHWDRAWPSGPSHGDFFPGNLLFENDTVTGLIDWPYASTARPLFEDYLNYEFSWLMHETASGRKDLDNARLQMHASPPLRETRQVLAAAGVELSIDSLPRILFLAAMATRSRGAYAARRRSSEIFGQLLQLELAASTSNYMS